MQVAQGPLAEVHASLGDVGSRWGILKELSLLVGGLDCDTTDGMMNHKYRLLETAVYVLRNNELFTSVIKLYSLRITVARW
jgi:hypothetical protein